MAKHVHVHLHGGLLAPARTGDSLRARVERAAPKPALPKPEPRPCGCKK